MSVTFYGVDHARLETTPYGSFPARIHLHADPQEEFDDPRNMNLAGMNARAVLSFLGVDPGEDLCGELPMPEIRRAIIKARATFGRRAPGFVRDLEVVHGNPRVNPDGTVELRPTKAYIHGIDEGYLWKQLDRLEVLVGELEERGATHLGWG